MFDESIWRTSSYSGGQGQCVEVADLPFGAAVRDSKRPDLGHLIFPASEWAALLKGVDRL
ncbi:DUF397 domain-containing protein [Nocardiopsis sp. RSe5-2]|uniref:DUF397 domain-containing protein n=1 Tax=Nocardiopsis endophytica TaxID=3018445 RepID=A0ABT4U5K7_9ACTN|nr:DUF397 domain-containing protein [Nocardiopsis endophytica]MDA2812238.1 DUF397 domain-containing protein [Nocardiopsis endophytica]